MRRSKLAAWMVLFSLAFTALATLPGCVVREEHDRDWYRAHPDYHDDHDDHYDHH